MEPEADAPPNHIKWITPLVAASAPRLAAASAMLLMRVQLLRGHPALRPMPHPPIINHLFGLPIFGESVSSGRRGFFWTWSSSSSSGRRGFFWTWSSSSRSSSPFDARCRCVVDARCRPGRGRCQGSRRRGSRRRPLQTRSSVQQIHNFPIGQKG